MPAEGSFNPFGAQVKAAAKGISANRAERGTLDDALAWYRGFDSDRKRTRRQSLDVERLQLEQTLLDRRTALAAAEKKVKALTKRVRSLQPAWWDLPAHFDSDRRKKERVAQADRRKQREVAENIKKQVKSTQERLTKARSELKKIDEELDRFATFDEKANVRQIRDLDADHRVLVASHKRLVERQRRLDRLQRPLVAELKEKKSDLRRHEDRLEHANLFDDELTSAANSYERHLIHERCASEFGDHRPRRIIGPCERAIAGLNRDVKKLERRLRELADAAQADVRTLVLDGNNLCYDAHGFVGDGPVRAVAEALADEYHVTVFFDGGICRQLRSDRANIRARYPTSVDVQVLPDGKSADGVILDAAADATTYIVSNDRFAEYPDKAAVRGRRIFRHRMANGRVIIEELDTNRSYS